MSVDPEMYGGGSIDTTERIGKTLSETSGAKPPAMPGNVDATVGLCEAANGNGVCEGAVDEGLSSPTGRLLPFSDEAIETFCTGGDYLRLTWNAETMDWAIRGAGLTDDCYIIIYFSKLVS